ncbi:hypothetical protein C9374_000078 [Naegleria lovaniensis]|uniref:Uncharacterized protein n=1 Tax=Naegleria lovaniensis TaxID=51637 RepID=A0AA88GZR3_NAELO|nr:uncharacterized protein C9374_000078 [Naegleria lovaniensis]KAG2388639.1 hypothetical protein C9374_000078 [Naegleria lovaniensis]
MFFLVLKYKKKGMKTKNVMECTLLLILIPTLIITVGVGGIALVSKLLLDTTVMVQGQSDDSTFSRNRIQFEIDEHGHMKTVEQDQQQQYNQYSSPLKSENHVKVRAVLHPGQEILSERIYFHRDDYWQGEDVLYELNGLHSHRKYEVRVSYPAYCPAVFSLKIIHTLSELLHHPSLPPQRRRLLNIEKMTFEEPPSSSTEDFLHKRFLIIHAEREAPSFQSSIQQSPILFNLALEELKMGFLPNGSLTLGLLVLTTLVLVGVSLNYFGALFQPTLGEP